MSAAKDAEKRMKLRKLRSKLENNIDTLRTSRQYYLDKAKSAKEKGETATYKLSRSGLASTIAELNRNREMLLNIDITTQMRDVGNVTREFLNGVESIFKEIARINRSVNLAETRKQLRSAVLGMENMQSGLDDMLSSAEQSFGDIAKAECSLTEKELDAMISGELGVDAARQNAALYEGVEKLEAVKSDGTI